MRAIVWYFNGDKVSPQQIKYKNNETKFMAYSTIDFGLKHNEIIMAEYYYFVHFPTYRCILYAHIRSLAGLIQCMFGLYM